ncbi:hypothetical protein Hamer_G009562 [Homarus americanus]|uniref:Uncharacterized protein n=1 Tax=Homarus americanus TaxID=6706 RepID=A0A8J5T2S9_HOMAM|nr:hypothetical protein Hamer_G009562 [Homarus americanus]
MLVGYSDDTIHLSPSFSSLSNSPLERDVGMGNSCLAASTSVPLCVGNCFTGPSSPSAVDPQQVVVPCSSPDYLHEIITFFL